MSEIATSNPLPGALHHYVRELADTIEAAGASVAAVSTHPAEGAHSLWERARQTAGVLVDAVSARQSPSPTVRVWPSLGLLEPIIWSRPGLNNLVVVHDPVPIVKQFGYGRMFQYVASRLSRYASTIVVHSAEAKRATQSIFPSTEVVYLPHPILMTKDSSVPAGRNPTVLVAGQFKPERDLNLLVSIADGIRTNGLTPRIVGRGWPDVDGWDVENRFLSEEELAKEISEAGVVLIPYARYYQSGIAIRALESQTPVVGRMNGFLSEVLGGGSPTLVDERGGPDTYVEAILDAYESDGVNASAVYQRYAGRVSSEWELFLSGYLNSVSDVR